MSYTVQAIVNRTSLTSKKFRTYKKARRFVLKILHQYDLQVDVAIDKNSRGDEELICTGNASRFFISAS